MSNHNTKDYVSLELESTRGNGRRNSLNRRDIEAAGNDAEPFFGPDVIVTKPKPPKANPESELDDDDEVTDTTIPFTPDARPGIDDGLFPSIIPRIGGDDDDTTDAGKPRSDIPTSQVPSEEQIPNGGPRRRFPQPPTDPNIVMFNGVPTVVPDVNLYQQKKTLAQGMMDIALFSANANQLRYVVESSNRHPYYYFSLTFIACSLLFQIAIGIGLILNSKYDVNDRKEICKANRINNCTVVGIFVVTVVNVFISVFGVADPNVTVTGT